MFASRQHILREQIEQVIMVRAQNIVTDITPEARPGTVVIKLFEPRT